MIEPAEKRAVTDLFTDRMARLPIFQQGDTVPLSVGVVNRIGLPWNSLVFEPEDIINWSVRATIETEVVASLETDPDDPAATVFVEQLGDGTHNHKVSVTLSPNRYGGNWTFTVAGVESGLIGYDDNAAQVKTILGAIVGVGAANLEVSQTGDDVFLIEFVNSLGLQAIAGIDSDGTTLKVIATKSGTMDLRTEGIDDLFADTDETERVVAFRVLGTPPAGTEQILCERDITLQKFSGDFDISQPVAGMLYDSDIDALTGTPDALETVLTANLGLRTKITFVIDDSDQSWILKSGAAGAGEIAPLDYDSGTNNKHWTKVGGF